MDLRISHIEKWNCAPSLITTLSMLANNKTKSFLFHSWNYTLSTQENNYRGVLTSIQGIFLNWPFHIPFGSRPEVDAIYDTQDKPDLTLQFTLLPLKHSSCGFPRLHLHKVMLQLLVNRGQILKASLVQIANWFMPKPLPCVARVNHGTSSYIN